MIAPWAARNCKRSWGGGRCDHRLRKPPTLLKHDEVVTEVPPPRATGTWSEGENTILPHGGHGQKFRNFPKSFNYAQKMGRSEGMKCIKLFLFFFFKNKPLKEMSKSTG